MINLNPSYHMRRWAYAFILCCVLVGTANARNRAEFRHYMFASVAGAYDLPVGNQEHLSKFDALSYGLMVGYEGTYRHLLLQTGLGVRLNDYRIYADNYTTSMLTFDTQNTEFTYTSLFHDRKDKVLTTSLSVPLLAGGRWSYFYFLAGVVGTFRVHEKGSAKLLLTSTGVYDRYSADLAGMNNHAFYTDEPVTRTYDASYVQAKVQVSPYVELGADFHNAVDARTGYRTGKRNNVRVRVAAFAQCGLLNEHSVPQSDLPYVVNPIAPYNLDAIQIPALLDNNYTAGTHLRNMYFGLRVTVLFGLAWRSAYCVMCEDY